MNCLCLPNPWGPPPNFCGSTALDSSGLPIINTNFFFVLRYSALFTKIIAVVRY